METSVSQINIPNLLTISRKSLKDNYNPRVSHIIKVLDLATNNQTVRSSVCTIASPTPTIFHETGQIDINKFTDIIMHLSQQYSNYLQTRIPMVQLT